MRTVSKLSAVAVLAAGLMMAAAGGARAQECSARVSGAFKGKLIITDQQLDLGGEPADVIAAIKKKNLTTIKNQEIEDVPTWGFFFTAFMSRAPGATSVSLDFFTDDAEKRYVANKRLNGISPSVSLLQHNVIITEDDGLTVGKRYQVKLTAQVKGRDITLASTTLTAR